MVRKLFYRPMGTTGFNTGTRKLKEHNFSLFSQKDFWLYHNNRITITIVLNTFVSATRYFWHQQCLLSWAWKLKWALGFILSSTLQTQNGNKNCACKYWDRAYTVQKRQDTNLSGYSQLKQKPAQQARMTCTCWEAPSRHCIAKTFWSEAGRPAALGWHTLWPANSNCKTLPCGFYKPLERDFSTMELSWITSKGTIARGCVQDISFLPFLFYFHIL